MASHAECPVLVVIAHPDDEVFACGTLRLCADAGFPVSLVCVTDGEGGGEGGGEAASLGEIRRGEMRRSAEVLGIGAVEFLALPDVARPDEPGEGAWDQGALTDQLAAIIEASRPALILTHGPWGGYGHPAHRLTHRCVVAAARQAAFGGTLCTFCGRPPHAFFSWHFESPADVLVDARGLIDRRAESLAQHQSQLDYFLQPYPPRSPRKLASALCGYALRWTEWGRKRVPIGSPRRFFARFPVEGFTLHQAPGGAPSFFAEHFADDPRVETAR